MNILVIEDCASFKKGGAERSMRKWCEFMFQKGHPVFFIYGEEGDFLEKEAIKIYKSPQKINLNPIGNQGLFSWIKSIYLLYKYCRTNNIDLVFTHIIHAFPLLRILKMMYPMSIGVYFKWVYSKPSPGKFSLWGIKCIDKAIGNSQYVVDYWKRQGAKIAKNNAVVPNGIPPSIYAQNSTPNEIFTIIFAGRIYPEKGLHILIKALATIQSSKWKLFIAGNFSVSQKHTFQSYHQHLISLIRENELEEKVHFLGFTTELRKHIRLSDLVVVPSIGAEAQSLVLMEAMAESTLVIGSKVGGIPERLSGNLSNLLFEPGSEKDLANKIEEVMAMDDSERNYYRNQLLSEFKDKYEAEKTISNILNHFGINI
jgi:glycosyltransferase involved in cell wall biosynthesis